MGGGIGDIMGDIKERLIFSGKGVLIISLNLILIVYLRGISIKGLNLSLIGCLKEGIRKEIKESRNVSLTDSPIEGLIGR